MLSIKVECYGVCVAATNTPIAPLFDIVGNSITFSLATKSITKHSTYVHGGVCGDHGSNETCSSYHSKNNFYSNSK